MRVSLSSSALRAGRALLPLIKSTLVQTFVLLRRPGEDEASLLALKLQERAGLRAGQLSERARRAAMKRAQFLSSSASADDVARIVLGGGVEHENGSVSEAADAPLSASLQMDHGKWEISAELFAFASPPPPSLSPLSLSCSLSPPPLHPQLFPAQAPPFAHPAGPQLQDIRAEESSIQGTREKIHEMQHRQQESHQPKVNAQRGHLYAAQLPCASASRLGEEQELQRGSKQNQHGSKQNQHGIFSLLLTAAPAPHDLEQSSERQEAGAPNQVAQSPRSQERDASTRQSFRRQHSKLMAAAANAASISAMFKALTTEAQKSGNANEAPAQLESGISPSPRALFLAPLPQPPRTEGATEQIHETQHQQQDSHEPTVNAQKGHLYAAQLPCDEEQELQRGSEYAELPAKVWAIVSVTLILGLF